MVNDGGLLLLFDIDGTLVRTGGAGMRAFSRSLAEHFGWDNALEAVSPAGKTDRSIAQEVARVRLGRELTAAETTRVFSRYLALLRTELATADGFRVLPGIRAFLERESRRARHVLGLATGNLERGARLKLEPLGLQRFFPFGGFGSDAEVRADVVRIAIARGEASAGRRFARERIVIVGDTPLDVAAADVVGVRSLAVATGPHGMDALRAAGADCVVPDFTAIETIDAFLAGLA